MLGAYHRYAVGTRIVRTGKEKRQWQRGNHIHKHSLEAQQITVLKSAPPHWTDKWILDPSVPQTYTRAVGFCADRRRADHLLQILIPARILLDPRSNIPPDL